MALAGLRLAKLLNDTIGKMTPRDFVASQTAISAQSTAVPAAPTRAVTDARGQDVKVWVNTSSKVFHCPGTQWYGTTKKGEYMTEADAIRNGYRPAGGNMCE
jgi:hypothetical protein